MFKKIPYPTAFEKFYQDVFGCITNLKRVTLEKEGFKVKTLLQVGNPRTDLIQIARREDVSLIVMGLHGKGRMEGILWGSVSRNVAEYSERPILLIKGGACGSERGATQCNASPSHC